MIAAHTLAVPPPAPTQANRAVAEVEFDQVYEEYFDFAWHSTRRLGVPEAAAYDVVQDVFLVVHQKIGTFESRSSMKTWVFGIVANVVRHYFRTETRKVAPLVAGTDWEAMPDTRTVGPHKQAERTEAVDTLYALLAELDEPRRQVFVLADVEGVAAPEIAEALGVNLHTVYTRLRAARAQFEQALARHHARDGWRLR